MEGERFDVIVRRLAERGARRRVLGALAGAALTALQGRRAGAQVGVASCRQRLAMCDERGACCEAQASPGQPVGCARVSQECRSEREFSGERCCGREDARCANSCACCRDHVCRDGRCRRLGGGTCLETVCCGCYRCGATECEFVRCVTAGGFQECVERCGRGIDAVEGVSGPGTTFRCGKRGRCRVECAERRSADVEPTVQRWRAGQSEPGEAPQGR
jgi:hypothetical protein